MITKKERKEIIESVKWFRYVYKKHKKLINKILELNLEDLIEEDIATIHGNKKSVYRMKGYKDLEMLDVCITTLQPSPNDEMVFKPTIVYSRTITSITYIENIPYYDLHDIRRMKYLFEVLWYESKLFELIGYSLEEGD